MGLVVTRPSPTTAAESASTTRMRTAFVMNLKRQAALTPMLATTVQAPRKTTEAANSTVWVAPWKNACNFDADALIDDGSCEYVSCLALGCTDSDACNFDASAQVNDGSCDFQSCLGCIDTSACNYDPSSTQDDGSCVFADPGLIAQGTVSMTKDGDGICDEFEVEGCTDANACNYDMTATDDDGSCDFCTCADAGGLSHQRQRGWLRRRSRNGDVTH